MKNQLFSAVVNAKAKSERDAVIEKYGREAVGEVLMKLNYIKKELEQLEMAKSKLKSS